MSRGPGSLPIITLIRACPIGSPPGWGAGQCRPTRTLHLLIGTFTSDSLRKNSFRPFHILMFSLSSISPSNPPYICRAQIATGWPTNYSTLQTSLSSTLPVPFYFFCKSRPCALKSDIWPPAVCHRAIYKRNHTKAQACKGSDSDQPRNVLRNHLTAINLSVLALPKYEKMSLLLA